VPSEDIAKPHPSELCPVPVWQLREFLRRQDERVAWMWDQLEGGWRRLRPEEVHPGERVLLKTAVGGYSTETGWNPKAKDPVLEASLSAGRPEEGIGSDLDTAQEYWQTIRDHAIRAADAAIELLGCLESLGLSRDLADALVLAARLHDVGKAHRVFQETLLAGLPRSEAERRASAWWAKSKGGVGRHRRPYFRHEFAGALALLGFPGALATVPTQLRDLVCYLVAAHHGKVRLSPRSLPGEHAPTEGKRYARGVWEGDILPAIDLGDGFALPEVRLDLSVTEIGLDERGRPSWLERMTGLRDRRDLGPFRLAYLEALICAADVQASQNPGIEGVDHG